MVLPARITELGTAKATTISTHWCQSCKIYLFDQLLENFLIVIKLFEIKHEMSFLLYAWWEHHVFETLSRKYKFQKAFSFYSKAKFLDENLDLTHFDHTYPPSPPHGYLFTLSIHLAEIPTSPRILLAPPELYYGMILDCDF